MITVLLNWTYIFVICFVAGCGILTFLSQNLCKGYRIRYFDAYLMTGLVFSAVYAQFFSLFYKVGLTANLVLCVFVCVLFLIYRKEISECVKELFCNQLAKHRVKAVLVGAMILLFAYGTSTGMIHYDTGLYHAQSIRWIEEYGAVKGIANLQCRLAYNSSSFALSALYSMAFFGGQSYHCCVGFLALILARVCLDLGDGFALKKIRISDFGRVMLVYYLARVFDEIVSPSADYFIVLIAFYIVIRWVDLLEIGENTVFPYAMLCVLAAYLVTVKLSAALIVLLVIWPAYYLVKDKKVREIVSYLLLGILVVVPYLIRNVILSGWLVYPVTAIDLFRVPWKVPKGVAEYDAKEVRVWGRGYTDVEQFDMPMREWLPEWFRGLAGMDKLMVLLATCMTLLFLIGLVLLLVKKHKISGKEFGMITVCLALSASFVFLLCTSPMIRYGCVYVYLTAMIIFGCAYRTIVNFILSKQDNSDKTANKNMAVQNTLAVTDRLLLLGILLFSLYKTVAVGMEIAQSYTGEYWVTQKDYENFEVTSFEVDDVTIYYPVEGDRVGYESFPSAPKKVDVGLLGEKISDGFYSIQ